jgi:phosphopantothenoylcysteine decarboxylase/phosphopantothenate--cysteine ligase
MTLLDFSNKNILIGVTGSISVYKSLELIRLLIKSNARIKVIMTEGAKEFITPLTFETISRNAILDDHNQSWENDNSDPKSNTVAGFNHITAAKWADIFIIAPATVNTINKIANGLCDNILLQSIMAYEQNKPMIIAPAANTHMLNNRITQASLEKLAALNFTIVQTQVKELACKDVGEGALAEPEQIYFEIGKKLLNDDFWSTKEAVVTGGGTVEKIDDVRFISNFSSGKMANELAAALYYKGASVTLITTVKNGHALPDAVHTINVQSTDEMFKALQYTLSDDKERFLFQASAVSDYIPEYKSGKLKKDLLGNEWSLTMKQNTDILKNIDKNRLTTIGFKLESSELNALRNAKNMLKLKHLDYVCLNLLKHQPFGSDTNDITLIDHHNETHLGSDSKLNQSFKILDTIKNAQMKH